MTSDQPSRASAEEAAPDKRKRATARHVDWALVRTQYEGREMLLSEIRAAHGLSRGRLDRKATRERWVRRRDDRGTNLAVKCHSAIIRTRLIIEAHIDHLRQLEPSPELVRPVAHLVRLLENLQRLERQHRADSARRRAMRGDQVNDQELRETLAQRISDMAGSEQDQHA